MLKRFQYHHSRLAVRCALLAMLLLVVGPVIGQVSAGEGKTHEHAGHTFQTSPHAFMSAPDVAGQYAAQHHAGSFCWQAPCDYCSLFQHMPVLMAMLPHVIPVGASAFVAPVGTTRMAYGGPAVFPQALTRAPPELRA